MRQRLRPAFIAAATFAAAIVAGCSSGPFATRVADGRYFQYLSPDNKVVAEYLTPDTATCQRHMANLQRSNAHGGPESGRCHGTSAAGQLPVSAAARDTTGAEYAFRFSTLDQCRRMMQAVASQGSVTRTCQ